MLSNTQLTDAQKAQIMANQLGVKATESEILAKSGLISANGTLITTDKAEFIQKAMNAGMSKKQAAATWNIVAAKNAEAISVKKSTTAWNMFKASNPVGWIMTLVTVLGAVISLAKQAEQASIDAMSNAASSMDELKSSLSSLDEYADKIDELNKKLVVGNLSQSEAYDARKELMSIQDEIINKYGVEREAIDGVTESIYSQIDAIKQKAASDWFQTNTSAYNDAISYLTGSKNKEVQIEFGTSTFD